MDHLVAWLKQPFNSQGNAAQWFAFVGLILVSLYLWHMVARDWQKIGD